MAHLFISECFYSFLYLIAKIASVLGKSEELIVA